MAEMGSGPQPSSLGKLRRRGHHIGVSVGPFGPRTPVLPAGLPPCLMASALLHVGWRRPLQACWEAAAPSRGCVPRGRELLPSTPPTPPIPGSTSPPRAPGPRNPHPRRLSASVGRRKRQQRLCAQVTAPLSPLNEWVAHSNRAASPSAQRGPTLRRPRPSPTPRPTWWPEPGCREECGCQRRPRPPTAQRAHRCSLDGETRAPPGSYPGLSSQPLPILRGAGATHPGSVSPAQRVPFPPRFLASVGTFLQAQMEAPEGQTAAWTTACSSSHSLSPMLPLSPPGPQKAFCLRLSLPSVLHTCPEVLMAVWCLVIKLLVTCPALGLPGPGDGDRMPGFLGGERDRAAATLALDSRWPGFTIRAGAVNT